MKNHLKPLLLLLCFAVSSPLYAFDGDGLLLKAIAMNFDFAEYDKEGVVVREEGVIYGGELELGKGLGPLWLAVNGQYLKGEVEYNGKSQDEDGNITGDLKSVTGETVIDTSFQLGRIYESWRRHDHAIIYFGAGFHQWARDIKSTTKSVGLFERYTWFYAHLGARGFLFRTNRSFMMVEMNILRTFRPIMDVSFKGKYDTARVSLGEHFGAKFSIPFRYEVKRWFHLYTEVFLEAWDLGGSDKQLTKKNGFVSARGTTFEEPRSTSRFYGAKVGLFLKFD